MPKTESFFKFSPLFVIAAKKRAELVDIRLCARLRLIGPFVHDSCDASGDKGVVDGRSRSGWWHTARATRSTDN
eukprot:4199999-Pleurochrysis_carterae.AAC.1